MSMYGGKLIHLNRRSPYGERGLKYDPADHVVMDAGGRSPYGERGLKSKPTEIRQNRRQVALLTESVD